MNPTVPTTTPIRDYRELIRQVGSIRMTPQQFVAQQEFFARLGLQLRPYQRDAYASVMDAFAHGARRILIVMPTGSGKTTVFAAIIARGVDAGRRILVLAHRKELIDQAADRLRSLLGDDAVGIVRADQGDCDAPVIVASVQTIRNPERLAQAGQFDLVVVDEAHHTAAKSYRTILDGVGAFVPDSPKVLGVTATPDRGDGQGLADIYDAIAYELDILTLIEQGWLADVRARRIHLDVSLDRVSRRHGDFADGALGDVLTRADAPYRIAESIVRFAGDRTCLVFVPTVKMAEATAEAITNVGIHAEVVVGSTPDDERDRTIADLRSGQLRVVVNVGVMTEGTDLPIVDCVVIGRPTMSRSLYVQMAGRGLRKHEGKKDCLILDLVGATTKHELQSAASLLGEVLEGGEIRHDETATEAITRHRSFQTATPDGRLVAFDVSLFEQRHMYWIRTAKGLMVLAGREKSYVVHVTGSDCASLHLLTERDHVYHASTMAQDLSIEDAISRAESNHRLANSGQGSSRNAPWRRDPMTELQRKRIRRMGYRKPRGREGIVTKGEAFDYITADLAERAVMALWAPSQAVA